MQPADVTVPLAALALVGTILTLVVRPLFSLLRQQNKTHERLVKSFEKVATSNKEIANETKKGNEEAKQRNGHLAELVIQTSENTIDALKIVKEQHVDEQVVEHQTIEGKQ